MHWVEVGEQQRSLKTDSSAFSNFNTKIIHCIAEVSQGILSPIVGSLD